MNIRPYILTILVVLAAAAAAFGHPLGNFSINQYSRLEVSKDQIKIRQVLDLAEIPTFQEASVIDTDKDGVLSAAELKVYANAITPAYLTKLFLSVNGNAAAIRAADVTAAAETGAGGLQTIKIKWDLLADTNAGSDTGRVSFRNENYSERLGWREMVINRTAGIEVFNSTAFGSGATDELASYPEQSLSSPLNERAAEFSYARGSLPPDAKLLQNRDGHFTAAVQKDRLADLISVPEITPEIALFGLLLAMGLGAMHAMSPGHGKAVVGAYLVGSKGTAKHAAFLGLTVTITHTLGVFALGLVMLFASNYILPETIMPFLGFFSGLIVLYIGLTMFKTRLLAALGYSGGEHNHDHGGHSHSHGDHSHADHDHSHMQDTHSGEEHEHSHVKGEHSHLHDAHLHMEGAHLRLNDEHSQLHGEHLHVEDEHSHPHANHSHVKHDHSHPHDALSHTHDGHTHSHAVPDQITWKSLLALGISGGLLPCPSALVLMLSAINLNRIGYGIILTIAFSFGLAATLTVVGLVFLYGGKLFDGGKLGQSRIIKTLPVFSAFVIACLGAVICYTSLS
ncbi:MAG: sulfite exporter TauE/SafE family protein [Pyrinomonadaceae bacterium]